MRFLRSHDRGQFVGKSNSALAEGLVAEKSD